MRCVGWRLGHHPLARLHLQGGDRLSSSGEILHLKRTVVGALWAGRSHLVGAGQSTAPREPSQTVRSTRASALYGSRYTIITPTTTTQTVDCPLPTEPCKEPVLHLGERLAPRHGYLQVGRLRCRGPSVRVVDGDGARTRGERRASKQNCLRCRKPTYT